MNDFELKKMSSEEAFQRMKDGGMEVTQEEADLIMEFLYVLIDFVIRKHFKLP